MSRRRARGESPDDALSRAIAADELRRKGAFVTAPAPAIGSASNAAPAAPVGDALAVHARIDVPLSNARIIECRGGQVWRNYDVPVPPGDSCSFTFIPVDTSGTNATIFFELMVDLGGGLVRVGSWRIVPPAGSLAIIDRPMAVACFPGARAWVLRTTCTAPVRFNVAIASSPYPTAPGVHTFAARPWDRTGQNYTSGIDASAIVLGSAVEGESKVEGYDARLIEISGHSVDPVERWLMLILQSLTVGGFPPNGSTPCYVVRVPAGALSFSADFSGAPLYVPEGQALFFCISSTRDVLTQAVSGLIGVNYRWATRA